MRYTASSLVPRNDVRGDPDRGGPDICDEGGEQRAEASCGNFFFI